MNQTPLEIEEQFTVVQWLEAKKIKFTATAHSTFTKSFAQKMKNKKSGLRPGCPDLLIVLQPSQSRSRKGEVLFLEMKRRKGGRLSPEQQEWQVALATAGQHVFVCHGCDEAIEVLSVFII